MKKKLQSHFLLLLGSLWIISCHSVTSSENKTEKRDTVKSVKPVTTEPNYATIPKKFRHSFKFGKDTSKHWERTVQLPMSGRFVQEAHYVTTKDSFPKGKLFADSITQNITQHLKRSYPIYAKFDKTKSFNDVYQHHYQKEWTPAEGGKCGQGSVGDIQKKELTPELELWLMNMMWAPGECPKRGTKFLLSYNQKRVIVMAGYETGPADKKFLGGVTCEVHAWLGSNSNSEIKVEYLADQNLSVGPIKN